MHLSASKVLAILCITLIISSAFVALAALQKPKFINNNYYNPKSYSYELNILNEFLDYNQLNGAIIIYTPSASNSKAATGRRLDDKNVRDNFIQLSLIRNLTENYYTQFVNTLSVNSREYLLQSLKPGLVVFMKYNAKDKGKQMILDWMSSRENFERSVKCLFLLEGSSFTNALEDLQREFGHLNIRLDADVTVAVHRNHSFCDLYDVYKLYNNSGSRLEIVYKGNWTREAGFFILKEFHYGIAIRRNNFHQVPVKAATVVRHYSSSLNMSNLEYLNNDKDFLDKDLMPRKTYQLLKLTEDLYNLTFEIYYTDLWGQEENGSWTGLLGLLQSNQADMSLCPMRYLLTRMKSFRYTRNIHDEKVPFIFRHPKRTSIRNIFLQPLADIVWWCVLALIIVTILFLAVHVQAEYKIFKILQKQSKIKESQRNIKSIQLPLENHFDFIAFYVMETILMQGPTLERFRCNSTRLLIVSVSIFSILLMQFYGAFIVSSLLSEPPRTITNLQALYSSSLELGFEDLPYIFDMLNGNKDPMINKLYKDRMVNKQTKRPNALSMEEGIKKIVKGNFAFNGGSEAAYRILKTIMTDSQICELQEINFHPFVQFTSGIALRKSSPLYEFVSFAIAMYYEAALKFYNEKKWEVNKIDCKAKGDTVIEIDLEHFAPALIFLLVSILISLLALIIEIIYKKYL